jgi:hypothetical protein
MKRSINSNQPLEQKDENQEMETKAINKRVSQKIRSRSRKRTGEKTVCKGVREKTSDSPIAGFSFHSLTFEQKPAIEVLNSINAIDYPYQDFAQQLGECYKAYCKVCKVKAKDVSGATDIEKVRFLYNEVLQMVKAVNPEAQLNIDIAEDLSYHFTVYHTYDYNQEVFCFPVGFLKVLEQRRSNLFRPMVWLYGYLINKVGFSDWNSNGHLDYGLDMLLEQAGEYDEMNPEGGKALEISYNIYKTDGDKYLKLIRRWSTDIDEDIIAKIKGLRVSPRLSYLKKWLIEGFRLINREDAVNINNLEYPGMIEDYGELSDAVTLDRQFFLAWDAEDLLCQQHIEGLNMDAQEFGNYEPCEFLVINKSVKRPYKHSEWAQDLKGWMWRGISEIEDYLEKK